MAAPVTRTEVQTFCALCVSRCGARAIVEDGAFVALEPDPSHPTGRALCLKGKVAPELVYHPDRLRYPLRRTRPKTDPDPGWQRISWDEALDTAAAQLGRLSREHGPESVVFSCASPSTSAISDSIEWIQRLRRAYGSPNLCVSIELCGWGRYLAPIYTYGASVPGVYLPDLENAGCILFWGYNPSVARLVHATATAEALNRGARLIVVDPRRAGLAHRANEWLKVRPGCDGALALAIIHVMIERGWYDRDFIRRWTNAPLLVRVDSGRLLRESELREGGDPKKYVIWDESRGAAVAYDPAHGSFGVEPSKLALFGELTVPATGGEVSCRPVFQLTRDLCARYGADSVLAKTGVPADAVERAARLLWEHRPVAFYAWSGVEQHSNSTQTARAIGLLYALTGSFDGPGGNVQFGGVRKNIVDGRELLPKAQCEKALGLPRRPLGPSQWEFVTSDDLYTSALESVPYRARGLVVFGANLLLANGDSRRGRDALATLDFYLHADLFMNPTAQLADIVLPAASAFEAEALAVGFEVSESAQSRVQLRTPVIEPRGEARGDTRIVFDLAVRLGLGDRFWNGDVEAGFRHLLEPSGVSLERLRAEPAGVDVATQTVHRKFAVETDGVPRGFDTPSRKIELYSETLLEGGYAPLPEFSESLMSPRAQPELAKRFPLILTCAKPLAFCESQHRGLPTLRRHAPDPEIELHPTLAQTRGIAAGDWVRIATPEGSVRARAKLNPSLDPDVVCGQHGWWQACDAIGAPGYDPFGPEGANLNLIISQRLSDPISGSVPHRAYLCDVTADPETAAPTRAT